MYQDMWQAQTRVPLSAGRLSTTFSSAAPLVLREKLKKKKLVTFFALRLGNMERGTEGRCQRPHKSSSTERWNGHWHRRPCWSHNAWVHACQGRLWGKSFQSRLKALLPLQHLRWNIAMMLKAWWLVSKLLGKARGRRKKLRLFANWRRCSSLSTPSLWSKELCIWTNCRLTCTSRNWGRETEERQ